MVRQPRNDSIGVDCRPKRLPFGSNGMAVLALSCLVMCGCGADTYEKRLSETQKYFEYLQDVNRALSPAPWNQSGVTLRVPRQFELVPAPETPTDEQEQPRPIPPRSDPRQPHYLGIELPGLLGAWQAALPVDTEQGNQMQPAHLYVCTNHSRWQRQQFDSDIDPLGFFREFGIHLAQVLKISPPTADYDWDWKRETIPMGTGYVPSKRFDSIAFELEVDHLMHDVTLFRYEADKIQVVIMFVIPQGVDPRQQLAKAMDYSLQTLEVSSQVVSSGPGNRKPATPGF